MRSSQKKSSKKRKSKCYKPWHKDLFTASEGSVRSTVSTTKTGTKIVRESGKKTLILVNSKK